MTRKEKGYLTIGEIAKVTGIHAKSIRYYERIGILVPAEVDPENGYRYYSPQQVHHLFAIKTCIHYGLPLKDFPKYCHGGTMYTRRYLEDAAALSLQKIRDLENKLAYLQNLQSHIQQSDLLMAEKKILELEQPQRIFLVREISPEIKVHSLFQVYSAMLADASQRQLQTRHLCGRIGFFRQGQLERLYAALLLSRDTAPLSDTLTLPAAVYQSFYSEEPLLLQAPGIFQAKPDPGQTLLTLETACVASQYRQGSPGYILRSIFL